MCTSTIMTDLTSQQTEKVQLIILRTWLQSDVIAIIHDKNNIVISKVNQLK